MIKKAIFHPKAREIIRSFPDEIKDKLGQSLFDIQQGYRLSMPKSRPMPGMGLGAAELRVRGKDGVYRVFYYTGDARGIFVFHAFVKKSQKTLPLELELGRKRLKEVIDGQE